MEKDKDLAEAMRKFLDDAESKYKSLVIIIFEFISKFESV